MRNEIERLEYDTDEFYKIDEIISTLSELKNRGANYLDFTGYSNVVKLRIMDISEDDNLIIDENDVVC